MKIQIATCKKVIMLVALVAAFSILNRIRGGGLEFLHSGLPGRALFYVSAVVAVLCAFIFRSSKFGFVIGLSYLVWGVGPWGKWFLLGRLPANFWKRLQPMSLYEKGVWFISGHSEHIALFIRHLNILPGLLMLGWMLHKPRLWMWSPVFAVAIVCCYEFAWDVRPNDMIPVGELTAGAVWGVLVWAVLQMKQQGETV